MAAQRGAVTMDNTPYPDVDEVLDGLLAGMQQTLGEKLVGLYLNGSLVTGDFDPAISDIDLLAVIRSDLDDREFAGLHQMQEDFVAHRSAWSDRIEIAYLSENALQTFRSHASPIAVISPGEPFHFKEAGNDWLINWYVVRQQGVALFGPSPQEVIAPISEEEYLNAVRVQVADWAEWVYHMRKRKSQAYAILTMCRALYALDHGMQASKKQAALWAENTLPQWAPLIEQALAWRVSPSDEGVDHDATFPATVQFVDFVVAKVGGR